jgi:hypothetical protein
MSGMFELLSEHQIKAWTEGLIENLRFNPDNGILFYRLTSEPASCISVRVPEDRVARWREMHPPPKGFKYAEHDLSEWDRSDGVIEIVRDPGLRRRAMERQGNFVPGNRYPF